MMRRCLCVLALAWLPSCGGSSSETPFPLEPDLERLEGKPPTRHVVVSEGRKADEPAASEAPPAAEEPAPPAPATWGASPSPAPAEPPPELPEVPLQ